MELGGGKQLTRRRYFLKEDAKASKQLVIYGQSDAIGLFVTNLPFGRGEMQPFRL